MIRVNPKQRETVVLNLFETNYLDKFIKYFNENFRKEFDLLSEITWIWLLVFSINDEDLIMIILKNIPIIPNLLESLDHECFEVFSNATWALANIQQNSNDYKIILNSNFVFDKIKKRIEYFKKSGQKKTTDLYESFFVFVTSYYSTLPIEDNELVIFDNLMNSIDIYFELTMQNKCPYELEILESIDQLTGLLSKRKLIDLIENGLWNKLIDKLLVKLLANDDQTRTHLLNILFNLTVEEHHTVDSCFQDDHLQKMLMGVLDKRKNTHQVLLIFENILESDEMIFSLYQNQNHFVLGSFLEVLQYSEAEGKKDCFDQSLVLIQKVYFFISKSSDLSHLFLRHSGRCQQSTLKLRP